MFIPKHHAIKNREDLLTHIETYALGTWVCSNGGQLIVNHVPFFLDRFSGPNGRLMAHVSRGNPVWKLLDQNIPSVVAFLGPQTYITPSWYPDKKIHGKVVPTWNYVAVHAHGQARAIESEDWMLDMLNRLTDAQESARENPWKISDAPCDYIKKMLGAIVGIEIQIEHLEGRLKASQSESMPDRLGTIEGLLKEPHTHSHAMAKMVEAAILERNENS